MTLGKHDGFTLIETFIAMFMLSITMVAFYSVYRMQTRSLKGQENRLEAQQTARAALDFMVRELRNARYNPTDTNTGADCGVVGTPGRPGIVEATDKIIHFSYDTENGNCSDVGENVKYSFAGSDITRNADGIAEPLTDGNVKEDDGLTLAYFAQDGTPLTSFPLNAADRDSIKKVSITVIIESKNMADTFGGALTATMTTNVDLRNPA